MGLAVTCEREPSTWVAILDKKNYKSRNLFVSVCRLFVRIVNYDFINDILVNIYKRMPCSSSAEPNSVQMSDLYLIFPTIHYIHCSKLLILEARELKSRVVHFFGTFQHCVNPVQKV